MVLVTRSDAQIVSILGMGLHKEFALKDLGVVYYFLGIQAK